MSSDDKKRTILPFTFAGENAAPEIDLTAFEQDNNNPITHSNNPVTKKSFSLLEMFNKPNTSQFLEQRGFSEYTEDFDQQSVDSFVEFLETGEHSLGEKITLDNMQNNTVLGTHRSIANDKAIKKLIDQIKTEKYEFDPANQKLTSELVPLDPSRTDGLLEIDLGIDLGKTLKFNKNMEGKFNITHVSFDTEAGEDSETNLNTAINWEAKRIVINWKIPKSEKPYYLLLIDPKFPDWQIIQIFSYDLWDALFIADYEVLLSTILISSLQQGSSELVAIYNEIKNIPIPLRANLMKENLYDKRRSGWFPYHAGYDINKLNAIHKVSRGKREKTFALKQFKTKFIKLRTTQERYDYQKDIYITDSHGYKVKLGNITPNFRFSANCDTRFHFAGVPRITLAPIQAGAFSRVFAWDLMILASSGQKFGGLEAVSKGTPYEKMKLDEEKIFYRNDMKITPKAPITDKLKYNIIDVLATLSGYSAMSYYFPKEKLEEMFNFKYENSIIPQVCNIYSTGSHAKHFLENYYSSKTGIKIKELLANIQKQREFFDNYSLTFMGGTTDSEVAKKVISDVVTPEELIESYEMLPNYNEVALNRHILVYMDYRSQYPHASWLSNAEKKIELACKNELHNYLNSNTEQIENDFWEFVLERIKYPEDPLATNFFSVLDGNTTIKTKDIDLQLRRTVNKRKTEAIIPSDSKITTHLADLAESCISYGLLNPKIRHLTPKKKIRFMKRRIEFFKAERLDLGEPKKRILLEGDNPEDQDLFMMMFFLRIEIEEEFGKHDPLAQFLKYVLNSIYGVTAESGDGTYLGKFLIWCVSSSITALSRFSIKMDKTTYKYLALKDNDPEVVVCYNDTDSDIVKATIRQHEIVRNIFAYTIPLEYEKDVSFLTIENKHLNEKINLQLIKDAYFLGKKKYGLRHLKEYFHGITPNLLKKLFVIYAKIHGVGKKATTKTKPLYKELYQLLLDNKTPKEIIEIIAPKWEYWKQVSYKKRGSTIDGLLNHITNPSFICKNCENPCKKDYNTNKSVCCQRKIKEKYPKNCKSILIEEFRYKDLPVNLFKIPAKTIYTCKNCEKVCERSEIQIIRNNNPIMVNKSSCCQRNIKTKYQKESYLFTNVKRLTKGTFGDYYKFKNVTFAVFAPLDDFRLFVHTVLTESKKIPLEIKPLRTTATQKKWLEFLQNFRVIKPNDETEIEINPFNNPNYLLESIRTSDTSISRDYRFCLSQFNTFFNKQKNNPLKLDYFIELLHIFRSKEILNYLDLAKFINVILEKEFNQTDLLYILGNPDNESYRKTNQKAQRRISLIDIINQRSNSKQNISEYLAFLKNNKDITKKIKQIITFNKSRFNLDYNINDSLTYIPMKPIKLLESVNDTELKVRADFNQLINCDAIVYKGNATLPRQDWKTSLQANQTYFNTQAILNIGHLFSQQYLIKRHKNKVILKEKLDDLLSKPPTEMPIALDTTQVVIPFKLRRYFDLEDLSEPIPKIDLLMSLDDSQVTNFLKIIPNKQISVLTYLEDSDSYQVNLPKIFHELQKKIKQRAYYAGKWINRKFAWELVSKSTNPTMINCTLRLNILVGQSDQENLNFHAELFLNPTSRGMFNLDLLNTTVNEVNENAWILKKLITHIYDIYSGKTKKTHIETDENEKPYNYNKHTVLRFFSRNASTTTEDLKNNYKYQLDIQHLLICFKHLENSIQNMRYSLETLAITENIHTNLSKQNIQILQNMFYQIANGTLVDYQWETKDAKQISDRIKQLKINKHSESDGFSIRNKSNWSVMSFYIKNQRQFISKLTRVTKDNPLQNERAINKVLSLKETNKIKENVFRIEITMFKWDKILQREYYQLLKDLVTLFKKMESFFLFEDLEEKLSILTKFKTLFQPQFQKIVQKNLEIPQRQDIFTKDFKPPFNYG